MLENSLPGVFVTAEYAQRIDVQEGIVVRCLTRLDELLREARAAAAMCALGSLVRALAAASELLRRDIVFAPSLYFE